VVSLSNHERPFDTSAGSVLRANGAKSIFEVNPHGRLPTSES